MEKQASYDTLSTSETLNREPDDPAASVRCQTITIDPLTNSSLAKWYAYWLDTQLEQIPPTIKDCITSIPALFADSSKLVREGKSIDDIATSFLMNCLVVSSDPERGRETAMTIAFAIIGWQTMLYQPAFGTCPPGQLAITDDLDGYTGQAFMALKQDHSRVKKPLPDFMLGFGLLLPKGNTCLSEDPSDILAFEKVSMVAPETLNAALLSSLAQVRIQWIDAMAPHLEFDKDTNTLFLFKFPSFCSHSLSLDSNGRCNSVIHCCAAQEDDLPRWASEIEISGFLQEIILSYRLLFGQDKKSRRFFQSLEVFDESPEGVQDPLLDELCRSKTAFLPAACKERRMYRLSRDFPILRSRLAILQQHMSTTKARSWKEIWMDQRDSPQWYTFWAVIIFGAAALLLALIQVILQIVQVTEAG